MASGISTLIFSPFYLLTWSLRRFSHTILFLLSPFFIVIYYASYVFVPVYGPVQMLPKLEVVYIFCGTAAVIGISVGCLLGLTNYLLFSAFSLTLPASAAAPPSTASYADSPQGIKQLRDERRRRRQERDKFLGPKASTPPPLKPKSIPTILEEEDEEEEYGTTVPAESLGRRARNGIAPFTQREDMSDSGGDLGF